MGCKPSKVHVLTSTEQLMDNGVKVQLQVIDLTEVASKKQKKLRRGKNKKIFKKAEALEAEYLMSKEPEEENPIQAAWIISQQPSSSPERVIVEMIDKFREVYEAWGSVLTFRLANVMSEASLNGLQDCMDAVEVARDNLYDAKELLKMVNNDGIDVLRDNLMSRCSHCQKMEVESKTWKPLGYTHCVYCSAKDAYCMAYNKMSKVKCGEDI